MARIFVCPSYMPDVSTKSVNSGVFQHICFRLIVLSNKLPNQALHLCLYCISPIQLSREYDSSFMNIARTEFTLAGNVKMNDFRGDGRDNQLGKRKHFAILTGQNNSRAEQTRLKPQNSSCKIRDSDPVSALKPSGQKV